MKLLLIFLPLLLTACGASAFDPKSYSELLKHHEIIHAYPVAAHKR